MTAPNSKNQKELIVVNFKELPETICLETRFITHAVVKKKKHEQVFYMTTKNGQMELTKSEDHLLKNFRFSTGNQPNVSVSIKPKMPEPVKLPTTSGAAAKAILQNNPVVPLATALSNFNNASSVISNLPTKPIISAPTVSIPLGKPSQLHGYNINTSMLLKKHVDAASMTDPKPILCDQIQQTDNIFPDKLSIAIQCLIDKELDTLEEPDDMEIEPSVDPLLIDDEKEEFLEFVTANSIQYTNNLRECLICGEICKNHKYFYGHMALHRGPKVLCFKCGRYIDHNSLLNKHSCRETKRLEKSFLRCPHHSCSVLAISRLELYDHINEHINNRMHKCTVCKKDFCTTQELLRHLLLRAQCYTGDKRKRYRLYGLESHQDRKCRVRVFTLHTGNKSRNTLVKSFLSQRSLKQNFCKLCFKTYRNKFVYNRHHKKCLAFFRKRLIRKAKI